MGAHKGRKEKRVGVDAKKEERRTKCSKESPKGKKRASRWIHLYCFHSLFALVADGHQPVARRVRVFEPGHIVDDFILRGGGECGARHTTVFCFPQCVPSCVSRVIARCGIPCANAAPPRIFFPQKSNFLKNIQNKSRNVCLYTEGGVPGQLPGHQEDDPNRLLANGHRGDPDYRGGDPHSRPWHRRDLHPA